MAVSTASDLIQALKIDDAVLHNLVRPEKPKGPPKFALRLPGFGVFGAGSVLVGLLVFFRENPAFAKELASLADVFKGSGDSADENIGKKSEAINAEGTKTGVNSKTPEGQPNVAKVQQIDLDQPKLDLSADTSPPNPAVLPKLHESPAVSVASIKPTTVTQPVVPAPVRDPEPEPTPEVTAPVVSKGEQIIGSGVPLGKGKLARPSADIDKILRDTSKEQGIDYATLYAFTGAESSFRSDATASGGLSTAAGLLQFTAPTWTYLTTKVYPQLGYTEKDRMDAKKSATLGALYIKSIKQELRTNIGHDPSIGETYLGYFMGVRGATSFLSAYAKNPKAKGADVFPKAAASNPQLFYDKGKKNAPLTLEDTLGRLEGKVTRYYAQAQQSNSVAETAPPIKTKATALPVPATNLSKAVTAVPQVQAVQPPDFDVQSPKGGDTPAAKNKVRKQAPVNVPTMPIASESPEQPATLFKDKNGRLVSIRG